MNLPDNLIISPTPFRENLEKELKGLNPSTDLQVKGSGRVYVRDRFVAQYSHMNDTLNLQEKVETYRKI